VKPIQTDNAVNPIQTDNAVKPIQTDNAVKPIQTDNVVKPNQTDNAVKPIQTDNVVKPNQTDNAVKPIQTDNAVKPIQTDNVVKPNQTDNAVKPIVPKPAVKWPTVVPPKRPVTSIGGSNPGGNRPPLIQQTDPGSKRPVSGQFSALSRPSNAENQKIADEMNSEHNSDVEFRQPVNTFTGKTSMSSSVRILQEMIVTGDHNTLIYGEKAQKNNAYC
ncbi:hypothetical protein, partial [Yersinia enterocolitica]|uniref:hypothetical protein n=1 Tax=Yersinia enterocolitica TaxID=630 RepID=UPI003D037098